ncbi:muscle, skeletal receptor tyrosine protein kinase isoform X1 [Hydra vulgaris]|nr:muscle, skeletal receptor tyrosine protein kinase [Hydra vulgaris]
MNILIICFIILLHSKQSHGSLNFNEERESICENEEPCRAPKIKIGPQNISLSLGDYAELTCVARGNPVPSIKWMKNEMLISDFNRFHIKNEKFRAKSNGPIRGINSKLEIMKIENEQFGTYKCLAKNSRGTSISSNGIITLKARKTNLLLPENVPGSSKYIEHGKEHQCVSKLNSSVCAAFFDSKKFFYKDDTTDDKLVMLSKIAEYESFSSFFSQRCRSHAMAFLCFYNLPYCQNSLDSKPKKMDVCQQDCIKLSTEYCKSEFLQAKDDRFLRLLIPDHCSTLSKDNCIQVLKLYSKAPNDDLKHVNINNLVHPKVTSIWYTIVPCLIFSVFISVIIISLAWRRHKKSYQSPSKMQTQIFPRVNPKILEIDRADLCDFRLLGDGSLGCVYSADYTGNKDGKTFTECVAVKSIINKALPKQIEDFVREAETRANFKHENVVALVGVISKEEPLSLIYEYTEFGDLHEYLLRHSPNFSDAHANDNCDPLEFSDLLAISTQVANGMAYLSSHAFVHKDLAARNCLVAENGLIKISDFSGLSDMYASDYLRSTEHSPLPIRWMSPESLCQLVSSSNTVSFSSASDIWSYGVLLWEIFSYGSRPYYGLSNSQCMQLIMDYKLLSCPTGCSAAIYNIMIECWSKDASVRCGFIEICNKLKCYGDIISHNKSSRQSSNSLQSNNSVQRSANSLQSHRSDFSINKMHKTSNGVSYAYQQLERPTMNGYFHERRSSIRGSPSQQVGIVEMDFEFLPLSSLPHNRQPPPSFVSSYYPPSMNCPPASAVLSQPSHSSHCSSSCNRSGCSYKSPSSSCVDNSHIYL